MDSNSIQGANNLFIPRNQIKIMPRIISIISAKGGAGKTVTTANLAVALADRGQNILVIDGNLTTPNLGMHFGIPLYPKTLHDFLEGRCEIYDTIHIHDSGVKVVPASLSADSIMRIDVEKLRDAIEKLIPRKGFIFVDGAAGLGKEARTAIEIADDVIIVTNPELPAVTDALKAVKICHNHNKTILGVVLNRITGKKHEMDSKEIRSLLEQPIIAKIPEDVKVQEAIALKKPVVFHAPNAKASKEFKRLAANLLGEEYKEEPSFLEILLQFFKK